MRRAQLACVTHPPARGFIEFAHLRRRERSRQLIERGGLVAKAGLVDLTDDDRATLYGAFLTVAAKLRGEDREQALVLWKRKGKSAFGMEAYPDQAAFSNDSPRRRHECAAV